MSLLAWGGAWRAGCWAAGAWKSANPAVAMLGDRCYLIRPERRLALAAERAAPVAADARVAHLVAERALGILRERRPPAVAELLACRLAPERVQRIPSDARAWSVAGGRWVTVPAGREAAVVPTRH